MLSKIFSLLRGRKNKFVNTSPTLESSIEKSLKQLKYKIKFKTVLEIGSRDGYDADRVAKLFNILPENVFIAEANPDCYQDIVKRFPKFKTYNLAIYNTSGFLNFNKVYRENVGTSSLLNRNDNYYDGKSEMVQVETITGEEFLNLLNVEYIDFCKIDVEGATYEVLESFKEKIKLIGMIHVECEHKEVWVQQKLYIDIQQYLLKQNFKQIFFEYVSDEKLQSDSIWLNLNKK